MEQRIIKMEKEMAIMSTSLVSVSKSLERMSDVHVDTRLLDERLAHMDRDLKESFERVHKRIDEESAARNRVAWLIISGFIVALVGLVIKGGLPL